jgi:CheY-like chemotaxis protein
MTRSLQILVVDDDEVLRKVISSVLAKAGTIHALSCGNDAIAYLQDHHIDLIFSDVCMPNGTGVELLDWVQKNQANVPVVLVTGQSYIPSEEALLKGARHVISKPFRMKTLLDIANQISAAPAA